VPGFHEEIQRLQFDLERVWRVTSVNTNFRLCANYPEKLLVPQGITDKQLEEIAKFRSQRRIPSILWRHPKTGAVLARCSQPEVGWLGWRSEQDEKFMAAMAAACASDSTGVALSEDGSVGGDDTASVSNTSDSGGSVGTEPTPSSTHRKTLDNEGDADANGDPAKVDSNSVSYSDGATAAASSSLPDKGLAKDALRLRKPRNLLIVDARSYSAAIGNRARGGGVECKDYYQGCEIEFMNLANIHSVRKSSIQLRQLCSSPDQASWYSGLEATKWLTHISGLLRAAVRVVTALEREERPVVVHCSDGWDRTPQIVALAQLLLDPYYRTIEGFEVLVKREWMSYGHKMADRNGGPFGTADVNERCPVFLQFLDCVHQVLYQFPCHFQFNFTYLIKLARHVHSNLFGDFLCNSEKERQMHHVQRQTRSIWRYLRHHPEDYCNYLFNTDGEQRSVWPKTDVNVLMLWHDVFAPSAVKQGAAAGVQQVAGMEANGDGSAEGQQQQAGPANGWGAVLANGFAHAAATAAAAAGAPPPPHPPPPMTFADGDKAGNGHSNVIHNGGESAAASSLAGMEIDGFVEVRMRLHTLHDLLTDIMMQNSSSSENDVKLDVSDQNQQSNDLCQSELPPASSSASAAAFVSSTDTLVWETSAHGHAYPR